MGRPQKRIANLLGHIVLGLDGAATASRLVRLLLADPLSPKAEWEDYLEKNGVNSDAGLLIK
jgi:hypothetical protein